jgi:hypothetical protein
MGAGGAHRPRGPAAAGKKRKEKAGLGVAQAASSENAEGDQQGEDDELLHGADPRPLS